MMIIGIIIMIMIIVIMMIIVIVMMIMIITCNDVLIYGIITYYKHMYLYTG